MNYFKLYPTPIAGLTLGVAGIAAFWGSVITNTIAANTVLILIAAIVITLLLPLIGKFVFHPKLLWEDLKHPTVGSVVPTFAMTLMLLSKTIGLGFSGFASALWLAAVILHASFFSIFCFHRLRDIDINHLVPSWFVPPIGIVVACLTVPTPVFMPLAYIILTFGIVAYMIMLPMVIYRLSLGNNVEDARKPTLAVLAAPASLTLAGYLSLSNTPSPFLVIALFTIAILMTVSVYIMLVNLLRKLDFSPAYSAFTFPLAISATASYKVSAWADSVHLFVHYSNYLYAFGVIEGVIATTVIIYVFQHYLRFLFKNKKSI